MFHATEANPYSLDTTITLASGGRVRLNASGLTMAGLRELLDIVRQAMDYESPPESNVEQFADPGLISYHGGP